MTVTTSDIQAAVRMLQAGGVIAYATEAVFGLGCDPRNLPALEKLLQLKQRPPHKGLILIAGSEQQLHPYLALENISAAMWQRVRATWPGPVTWLLPVAEQVSSLVCGEHSTLAVRVSAQPQVRALCAAFGGAIISTSANLCDKPPARSVAEVQAQFAEQLDLILIGETGGAAKPSEIRDAATGNIVRPG